MASDRNQRPARKTRDAGAKEGIEVYIIESPNFWGKIL